MGLDPLAQAVPKVCVVSPSLTKDVDLIVNAFSMGVLHKAIPMTLGLCLGVAAGLPHSIIWDLLQRKNAPGSNAQSLTSFPQSHIIRISHPTGVVQVGAEFKSHEVVKSAKVIRTGKRLMTGAVYW